MLLITRSIILLFACVCINSLYAQDRYLLSTPSFDPGTVIKIQVEASAPDGVLLQQIGDEDKHGTMAVNKKYDLERKTLAVVDKKETKIHYNIIRVKTEVEVHYDGESAPHKNVTDFSDIQITGKKNQSDEWRFEVEDKRMNPEIESLVSELQAYENRKWFTNQPVSVGDSWQIYPAFTDFVMTRDLKKVETEGTMTLLKINKKGKDNIAALKFNAESKGWDNNVEKGLRKASFETQGLLQYSINQRLDTSLVITSRLESFVQKEDSTVSVVLPFTYKVTKSVVK